MKKSIWAGVLIAVAAYALNTVMLYTTFTSRGKFVIWDFHPVFVAGQYVLRGVNPYSDEVTRAIQILDYGRPARPGEDPQSFAYPAFLAYLVAPLTLLPLAWAQAAWLSLLQVVAIAGAGLSIAIWNWPGHRWARIGLVLWWLLFYPIVWGFILGQFSLLFSILPVLVVWAVGRQHDEMAGAMLGLITLKPQLAFLFVPGVMLWAIARRRWPLAAWAGGSLAFVLIFPMLFHPGWVLDFIHRLTEYNAYSPFVAPAIVAVQNCCGPVAPYLAPLIVVGIAAIVSFGWWAAARTGTLSDFVWAAGATLIATTLIAPQISIVNQAILLLPLIGVLKWSSTKGWTGIALVVVALTAWGVGLWALSLIPPVSTARPRYPVEHQILSPIVPLSLGVLWLVGRPGLRRLMGASS